MSTIGKLVIVTLLVLSLCLTLAYVYLDNSNAFLSQWSKCVRYIMQFSSFILSYWTRVS